MTDLDVMCYNINFLEGTSDEVRILIAKTISRLPEEHREQVIGEVIFISVDNIYGQYEYFRPSIFQKEAFHFIILALAAINDEEEKMFVIAHEIAHYTLAHRQEHFGDDTLPIRDIEDEADTLCEKWGFMVPERRRES